MAGRRRTLFQFTADARDVHRELRQVREDVRAAAREKGQIKLELNTAVVRGQIIDVQKQLVDLRRSAARGIAVDADVAKARLKLIALQEQLARLEGREINIDVDVRRGGIESLVSGFRNLERNSEGVRRGISDSLRAIPFFGRLVIGIFEIMVGLVTAVGSAIVGVVTAMAELAKTTSKAVSATASLGEGAASTASGFAAAGAAIATAAGAVVALALAVGGAYLVLGGLYTLVSALAAVIEILVSVIFSLVASLAAAAGGFALLATALGGALIPLLLAGGAVLLRFNEILKARQQRELALKQAVTEQKNAEQAREAAVKSHADAVQRASRAEVEARKAMTQALEDQEDAELGLERAQLGLRESRLNLADAQAELRAFVREAGVSGNALNTLVKKFSDVSFDPSAAGRTLGGATGKGVSGDRSRELAHLILNVQKAQLGVKEATDAVGDSERKLAEARQRNIQFAKQGLRAYEPYADALDAVDEANEKVAESTDKLSAATVEYQRRLRRLTNTERGTLARINTLVRTFQRFAKALSDPIFKSFNRAFDGLRGSGKAFESALGGIGRAFGSFVTAFARFLGERQSRDSFGVLARGAKDLVGVLGSKVFIDFLRIIRNIATAAMPELSRHVRGIVGTFRNWAESTGNLEKFRKDVVRPLVGHFDRWWRLAKALAGLVLRLFQGADKSGGGLVEKLTKIVDKWNEWLDKHPKAVEDFFIRQVARARRIYHWIKGLVDRFKDLKPAGDDFVSSMKALAVVASGIYHTFKVLTDLMQGDLKKAWEDLQKSGLGRRAAEELTPQGVALKVFRKIFGGKQHGGEVGGSGSGDIVPTMLEPGEFVIRSAMARKLGGAYLSSLNAGSIPTPEPSPREFHSHTEFSGLPMKTFPDERTFAALWERELLKMGVVAG